MAWPNDDLDVQHLDAATDKPSEARASILNLFNRVKSIIGARGQANGVAPLDGNGKVPAEHLSTNFKVAWFSFSTDSFEGVATGTKINLPAVQHEGLRSSSETITIKGTLETKVVAGGGHPAYLNIYASDNPPFVFMAAMVDVSYGAAAFIDLNSNQNMIQLVPRDTERNIVNADYRFCLMFY